jgi:hypothetical protein
MAQAMPYIRFGSRHTPCLNAKRSRFFSRGTTDKVMRMTLFVIHGKKSSMAIRLELGQILSALAN